MNLKEAFRFQNKLQSMMTDAQSILGNNGNITKVQNTYLRSMTTSKNKVIMISTTRTRSERYESQRSFPLSE